MIACLFLLLTLAIDWCAFSSTSKILTDFDKGYNMCFNYIRLKKGFNSIRTIWNNDSEYVHKKSFKNYDIVKISILKNFKNTRLELGWELDYPAYYIANNFLERKDELEFFMRFLIFKENSF